MDFFYGNADYLIQEFIADFPEKSLSSISFYFPDPWFKKKHHKRRLIQPELIKKFSKRMRKDSLLFIKSDVRELYEQMNSVILGTDIYDECDFRSENTFNPNQMKTERELYVLSKKLTIYQQTYKKIKL